MSALQDSNLCAEETGRVEYDRHRQNNAGVLFEIPFALLVRTRLLISHTGSGILAFIIDLDILL